MNARRAACGALLALAALSAARAAPTIVELPPLLWSDKGPEKSAWAQCTILLAGRRHREPPPQAFTLCYADGKPSLSALIPVHRESVALAVSAGPDGGLRAQVGRPGGVDEIRVNAPGAPARIISLIEDEALYPRWLGDAPDVDGDGRSDLVQATYAGVSLWHREPDETMTRRLTVPLAPDASFDGEWITVRGKYLLEPAPPAPLRWTWPEMFPGKRLKTFRVPIDAADARPCEVWIDAEAQVNVTDAEVLSGQPPRLVALTRPADRFALFGNSTLLVAPLACDATARGTKATQRIETDFDSNIGWVELDVRDVNGDGILDVLIIGRLGVINAKLKVAVYAGLANGAFAGSAASATRSDLEPLEATWKDDLDGDGRSDIVVLDKTRVLLVRGIKPKGTRDLPFDLRKATVVDLPDSVKPRALLDPVDFDGDGRLEALVVGEPKAPADNADASGEKYTRLVIVPFPAESR